ncbi:DUF916 and DUF3324 domain-containing protein, partial [Enterococcus faecalis]|uniref:DUF916 and DUF3324 domain-containing protein n=1 Tax=Enterococcus faecalis TaxID=1351 RepID=UPI0030C8A698
MRNVIKNLITGIIMIVGIFSFQITVFSSSNDFTITPVLPENQKKETQSYFDMLVTPMQEQTIQILIHNNSSVNQKYKITVNTAATNRNGIIDYSLSTFEKDSSMKIAIKDCITIEQPEIEVPSGSEKEVNLRLKVPAHPFKGILLGGITVEPIIETEKEGITNVFTRTLAIQLAETEEVIKPELKAGKVILGQDNYRNNIQFELRNSSPIIISRVKATITVKKKEEEEPLFTQKKEQLSFAPNTKFNLMSEWAEQFQPGEYRYTIELSDEEGHQWRFAKEFKINETKAKQFNQTSVDKDRSSIR